MVSIQIRKWRKHNKYSEVPGMGVDESALEAVLRSLPDEEETEALGTKMVDGKVPKT